jgi:hypothetical protein
MSARNGSEPPSHDRSERLPRSAGTFSPEVRAMLERRTAAFQRATSGKGLPMTWGKGDGPRPGFEPKTSKRSARRK